MRNNFAKRLLKPLLETASPLIHPDRSAALWRSAIRTLKGHGFAPKTVFDVGVANGTPDLYAAFPHARFYLVDPTRESRPHMEEIAQRLDARIFNVALGDRDGEMAIEVRLDDIAGATFFREIGPLGPTDHYQVPMRRFDTLFDGFERPALCKIDVQGAELMVLTGMGARLEEVDALIVETSVISTIANAPEVFDIISFMKQHGFVIFDLMGMLRRPLDDALAQVDLLFVGEDSPLRADHRWRATTDVL